MCHSGQSSCFVIIKPIKIDQKWSKPIQNDQNRSKMIKSNTKLSNPMQNDKKNNKNLVIVRC